MIPPQQVLRYKQKEKTCPIVVCPILTDHRVKVKVNEKRDKYLDLARELKILWIMKVAVIPIVIGALGTIPRGLVKGLGDSEIRGQEETIQITVLLKNEFWRLEEACCHSNSSGKPSANASVKNSQRSKNIYIYYWYITRNMYIYIFC